MPPRRPIRKPRKLAPPGADLLKEWRGDRPAIEVCLILGINESALYAFQGGRATPGLERATRIQEATGGAVPATSWVVSSAKKVRRAA